MRVEPISCYRPRPEKAAEFAALPYDVFDREQARAYVKAHPGSFLAIDRPETAFSPEQDMYAPEVYAKAAELIRRAAQDGTILKDDTPCYYIYRLEQDGRSQTGVVCACAVEEYANGTIKRHENTRRDKERDRIEHIRATGAQTGPIFLTYRDEYALDVLVGLASTAQALYDFTDDEGVRQTVWRIARESAVEAIRAAFSLVPCAYIADGHHRAASAVAVSRERREAAGPDAPEAPFDLFLAVLFPSSQLRVLAYNRVVADSNGLDGQGLVDALEAAGFSVGAAQAEPIEPASRRSFGMFFKGTWRTLTFVSSEDLPKNDPVAALDASILQERVLAPILGIGDPREDPRISFVGGIAGTDELERRAADGGIAFSLFPTSVDELMAVSDAGLLMPPKSTWFEPKLRSGLFIRRI
ncbi:MAG: DUF1015 domain-containing protein [Olsenella sp.]|nr:DUF1015 domain-containing protein [Olsenella sp.]